MAESLEPDGYADQNPLCIGNNDAKDRRNCDRIIVAGLVIQISTLLAVVIILTLAVVAKISTDNTVCPNNAPLTLEPTAPNYSYDTNVTCNCTCPGILPLLEIIAKNESDKFDLLYDIVGSLANIKQTSKTTSEAVNDVFLAVEKNTSVLLGRISQLLEITNNASKRSDFISYDIVSSLANINMTIKTTSGAVDDLLLTLTNSSNNTSVLLGGISQLLDITNNASERSDLALYDIVGSLANIKQTSTTTSGAVNDMLLAVENILDIQNKTFILNHIQKASCKDVKSVYPSSSSGYYHLNGQTVYCNMRSLCGSGGGWTRLAYLDMTDATQSCPSGLRLYTSGNVRACGRPSSGGASCASVKYETNGISYSAICGRVTGYQYASPDAVSTDINPVYNIDSHYIDGVSITRGSPRQHVWTLIAGLSDTYNGGTPYRSNCPCNNPPPGSQTIPSFVGSNYFCESGNHGSNWGSELYTGDPLWDGQGCGPIETPCCAALGLPWFHRNYGSTTTTDYIELRVCGDESTGNEDTPVSFYEIYVK